MKRGEIRWYRFQQPDKKRPVLILTRDSVIEYLNEVTVAPITSTVRGIPSETHLFPENGTPKECVVNCDHLQTVSKDKLGNVITTLPQSKIKEVQAAIRFALGLED